MKKESIMTGIIGLLAGIIIAGATSIAVVNSDNHSMMRMMGMHKDSESSATDHSEMSMSNMTKDLKNKSGDDFDKAFLEMMIAHHEGAVDMAELANTRAKHDEIKKLSQEITSAQLKEIADMKRWQKDWGYPVDEVSNKMHSGH